MSDEKRPLTELSEEELIAELNLIRERRIKAREARVRVASPRMPKVEDLTGRTSKSLDDLFSDDLEDDPEGLTDE